MSLVLAAAVAGAGAPAADAHAGLTSSDPPGGARLGATPTQIQLTFSERPDPKLSNITVLDRAGRSYQTGRPQQVSGDPLSLAVPISQLTKGVYTVRWRIDSAVDGHATTGYFSFGVQALPPQQTTAAKSQSSPVSSALEVVARWILLVGLVLLLGAVAAELARFGTRRSDLLLAAGGWATSLIGLVLLADAQRRNAGSSLSALLGSPVGHALIWRAVALALAGVGLSIAARGTRAAVSLVGFGVAGTSALAAVVVHVASGHAAAAGSWPSALTVIAQAAHVAAVGVWIGGLVALLLTLRGEPSEAKAQAVRRFATLALAGLIVVTVTGVLRAVSELRAVDELWQTGYGRAVVAKLALVAIIAGLAAGNRRRALPGARSDLAPLRRTSSLELTFAASAIAVAALLGTLAPPVASQGTSFPGLLAKGSDVGKTVRVKLTTVSNEPGPNRFFARISGYDSDEPIPRAIVQLLFTPLDDPGVTSSSLALAQGADGTYSASGSNLRFDGRWGVRVLIRRGSGAVEVPLELDPIGPPQQLSVERPPAGPPKYTKLTGAEGFVRLSPQPERAGPSRLALSFYFASYGGEEQIKSAVLTLKTPGRPTTQQPLQRTGIGQFVSPVRLAPGLNEIAVVARPSFGGRLRSVFRIDVPGD